jgi:hypothetical protein
MKTKRIKYLLTFVLTLWASALSAQSHWAFDYNQYQYQMTVWFVLQNDEVTLPVTDFNNYEVAAFVGDECRGVGTVVTGGGNTVCQIIVRSNVTTGEKITFKCYDKTAMEEKDLYGNAVQFSSDGIVGMPSSPYVLDLVQKYIPGDADGDGVVDLTDVVAVFEFFMNGEYPGLVAAAADYDGDGVIDLTDAVLIFEFYMNQ